ncbi:YgaP-like transmembrane domain [Flavobacterium sp.]|uniref:YgaP-like transmembrane domain n=1 Tax=Flavobacterium sp. TaxID=239 RepID=UPI0012119AB0|nr:YgaP-like transmembrane domain [Flavobacterium sp.]RZJ72159.1 MAG: DUF2892 domain-containing protein [Flavobacterium sp.]
MKTATDTKRNFSKIDSSGTDPNRYASVSNSDEARTYLGEIKNNFGYKPNVSTVERIAMIAAGSYLLYKALSGKKKSIPQGIAGGTMLARGISGYCPVYDVVGSNPKLSGKNVNINTKVTVDKTPDQAYNEWRDLSNLPKFMKHLSKVEEIDHLRSQWTAKGPAGIGQISWKAEILMQEPGKVLSWHSLPDSTIDNAGKVTFNDIGNGQTEIEVTISYHAPLGIAGEAAAKLLNPLFENMISQDVTDFKHNIDTTKAALN